MKFVITLSVLLVAAPALPAPAPAPWHDIGADNLLLNKTDRVFLPRNEGLTGFGAGTFGGAGGAVWTVWDPWALRDALTDVEPRIVYVRGRIDLTQMFDGSPGVQILVGSYKTIIGGDENAEITGGGLQLETQKHIIIQNIKFSNAISYAPGEQPDGNGGILMQQPGEFLMVDCVDIRDGSEFVWVDHCEFSDDPWDALATPNEKLRHRGLVTIKRNCNWITISNNIFRNHNMNFLIGHNDEWTQDIGKLKVTIYLNWFQGIVQRSPRVRFGEVHVLNNLYTDNQSYSIGVGYKARIYAERNIFINTRRAWSSPTSVINEGYLLSVDNLLVNSSHDAGLPSDVNWNPSGYYNYNPIPTTDVEEHVRTYAGTW